jgi:hypothetical protein
MSYELKEEFLHKYEDGRYRGHDIYHFPFEGHEYVIQVNFRPDEDNGGHEFEMLYFTEEDYRKIAIGKKIFKLYRILTKIYYNSLYKLIQQVDDKPHLKIYGFELSKDDVVIKDDRKDNIAINYVKKVLKIEKVFVDLHNNTIIKIAYDNV